MIRNFLPPDWWQDEDMSNDELNPLAMAEKNLREARRLVDEAKKYGEPQERIDELERLAQTAQEYVDRVTKDRSIN